MSTAPRQRRTAKRSEGPFQAPAASKAATVAHGSDTRGWSDSPRQLKQTRQIARLKTTEPASEPAQGGLPDGLRQGIESLSGVDMSGVRVHRNSAKAAALGAHGAEAAEVHVAKLKRWFEPLCPGGALYESSQKAVSAADHPAPQSPCD